MPLRQESQRLLLLRHRTAIPRSKCMTNVFRLVLYGVLSFTAVYPHPGVGIVRDSRGNVYFTDLKHVWRISPDGTKQITVRNVHTHHLLIDAQDNLFGEHLWYEGEATDRWGHRVWMLSADGTLSEVIPARSGFLHDYEDFHFTRDKTGTMYWAFRGDTTAIKKRPPGNPSSVLARAGFRNVREMTVAGDGTVYLVDLHDLVRITPDGTVSTMARNIVRRRRSFLGTIDNHAVMGIWTDAKGNVYVAAPSDDEVKKISAGGTITTMARSTGGWKPSGGLIAANGDLWILEYSGVNAVRVRRIGAGGNETVY